VGQVAFNKQANGSLIKDSQGNVIGSELIGQQFSLPVYFHGRPSAVGYAANSSGASNLGPTNPQLIEGNGSSVVITAGATTPAGGIAIQGTPNAFYVPGSYLGVKNYADQFRQDNGLSADVKLPADIVMASGSGLDPDISVDAANLQVTRILQARQALGGKNASLTADQLKALITKHTEGRDLGILGEERVNVLLLNKELDDTFGAPSPKPAS
jgi:K+-transporting ATPase ATPase C chain